MALNIGLQQISQEKNNQVMEKDKLKMLIIIFSCIVFLCVVLYFVFSKRKHQKNIEHFQKILKDLDERLNTKNELIKEFQNAELTVSEPISSNSKVEAALMMNTETKNKLLLKLQEFEASNLFTENTISLAMLSTYYETNSRYLSYLINTYKKKDFNNYINELRVNFIIEKLKNEPVYRQYKLAVLAEEAGFSSQNKFSTVFKKVTTISSSIFIAYLKKSEEIYCLQY